MFAPGEEVVCVDDGPDYVSGYMVNLTKGKIYIVTEITSLGTYTQYGPWVKICGSDWFHSHLRFRPLRHESDEEFFRALNQIISVEPNEFYRHYRQGEPFK